MALGDREFTSEEVAALCGVTRVTVADWIARGKISVRWTAGGHRRIPRASLAEFMERQGYALPRSVATSRALVLIVDDEASWRDRLRDELVATGDFAVETFRPGVEALLAIGAQCPDVLVVDMRMPGFDSRQLVEAARSETSLGDVAVVALTTFDEEVPGVKRHGADAALPKSRVAELGALIVRLLTDRQRRVVASEGSDESSAPTPPGVPPECDAAQPAAMAKNSTPGP